MRDEDITVYEPGQRTRMPPHVMAVRFCRNVAAYRELAWQLFRRDFLMSYRRAFLGAAWILISPLIGIVSWVFMNAAGILAPGDVGIPYPAYVLMSSSIWGLFMSFYSGASGTLGAGAGIITQVCFPHEVLLVKQCAQQLVNFLLGLALDVVVLLAFGVVISWKAVFFPVAVIPLLLLGAGVGLVSSIVSVVSMDFSKVIQMGLGFLMYVTPVIYSADAGGPVVRSLMRWNPLTYLVGDVRDLFIYGRFGNPGPYAASAAFALVFFMLAWRLFYVGEMKIIEKM